MSKALSKVNYYVLICSFLTFIFLFNFSFVSSLESSLEVSQWDKGNPSGNITNEYINNTYINQTLELNSTQFETGEPATIKTSWLTSFIESISKWANYYTKTEINDLISGISVSQPIRLNVQYPTISYGEIYYLSKQNGTITKWDLRSSDSGSVNIVVYNSTTTKFTAILSSASSNNSIVSVPVIDGEEILANITSVSGLDDFTLTMEVQ